MDTPTFIKERREAALKERDQLTANLERIQRDISTLDEEIKWLDSHPSAREEAHPRQPRAPRGERLSQILSIIISHQNGIDRGATIGELGIKGNEREENSVSNALLRLKRDGKVPHDKATGLYSAPQDGEAAGE